MEQPKVLVFLLVLICFSKPLNSSSCKENGDHKPASSPSRIKRLKHYELTGNNLHPTEEDANKKAQLEAAASVIDASRKKPGIPIKCLNGDTLERVATPSDSSQSYSEEIPALQFSTIEPFITTNITANNMQQIIVVEPATPTSPSSNQTSERNSHSSLCSLYDESQSSSSSAKNNSPRSIHTPHLQFLNRLPQEVYAQQEQIKRTWDKANPTKPCFYALPTTDPKA